MTTAVLVHRIDELAAELAWHGWHVAYTTDGTGEPALLVRARLTGESAFHAVYDDSGMVRITRGADAVGTAHTADEVHALLRATARR